MDCALSRVLEVATILLWHGVWSLTDCVTKQYLCCGNVWRILRLDDVYSPLAVPVLSGLCSALPPDWLDWRRSTLRLSVPSGASQSTPPRIQAESHHLQHHQLHLHPGRDPRHYQQVIRMSHKDYRFLGKQLTVSVNIGVEVW